MNRTDRLLGILLEFQARREVRAEDLARHFEVSVRTVYRDVQALSETGVPIVALPGKGYRLMDGYFLPPLSFTAGEAALLALGGAFIRDRVDPELRQTADGALRKLASVLPTDRQEAVARWQREIRFPEQRRATDERTLTALRAAIQERRLVRLLYQALRHPAPEERDVEPVSLVYLAGAWYLAAYCRLRRAPRLFRLDRIDGCEPLGERFALDERHAIGPELGHREAEVAEARVRFDPEVVRWVRERQSYFFRREESGAGGPIFVYALRDERELLAWLLAWGAAVQVLAPPALRQRLAAEAHAIAERHATAEERDRSGVAGGGGSPPPAPVTDSTLSGALP